MTVNSLMYCPNYQTKEQFERFIKARKTDIEMINESIWDAQEKLCRLEGKKLLLLRESL